MVAMQSFSLWPRGCGLSLACYWYLNLLIDYHLNHKTANLHCFSGQFCETMRILDESKVFKKRCQSLFKMYANVHRMDFYCIVYIYV